MPPSRPALVATLSASLAALAALTLARGAAGAPLPLDRRLQRRARRRRPGRVETLCAALTGQWPPVVAGALAAAGVAARRGRGAALPVLAAVPAANAAHAALKYARRERRPARAWLTGKRTPGFPSGHAARGMAAAGVLAHVAGREGVLPAAAVLPVGAGVAAVGAAQRVWVERHWASDVMAGWALGAAVAAGCAMWYDAARDGPPARDDGR